ncbi:hypothetical protein MLD38_034691 [Melastoma candidum]|uniref:Uncharacterized protein n=1 Tax=Melastoma candidum TaxID=119954 RepID=A0ACB9MCY9_9MYRT|nr:hypothetical protein MLD38_034691 [Melastoma candidum]
MEGESLTVQRLRCSVKNYDWGHRGKESHVAELFALNSRCEVDMDKPYAEIWMGTHDSGPSFLYNINCSNGFSEESPGVTLKSWIEKNPCVLGEKVMAKWGCDLPFLFKVLSIAKALSIQAHPDKELARVLHREHPNVYKDENHKPEMALAITKFEALCGFISIEELKDVLRNVPEIVELVGTTDANKYLSLHAQDTKEEAKSVLRLLFTHLMSAGEDSVANVVTKLRSRLQQESWSRQLSDKEKLVLRLEKEYPGDIGVISAFFFNYVMLNPGEALYLGANEPHAYISGECIECMATSDNVVRAGLTPKSRDVQTLCSMLTYKQGFPDILKGVPVDTYTKRYRPPFDEFEVDHCSLPKGSSTFFPKVPGPSIFVVTSGAGTLCRASVKDEPVTEGDVLFVPANIEVTLTSSTGIQMYRAGVNGEFLERLGESRLNVNGF